jgi:hypothetical protein
MRCKKYVYWLGWASIFLTLVFVTLWSEFELLPADFYWGTVISLLGCGIPMAVMGLCWALHPEDRLAQMARLSPWIAKRASPLTVRIGAIFGFWMGILMIVIGMMVAIDLALAAAGISVF